VDEPFVLGQIRDHLMSTKNPHVLHLGCGTSRWCELLENELPGCSVTHLDASTEATKVLRARLPESASIITADATLGLPFARGTFDAVVDKGAIDVFFATGQHQAAATVMAEVARVLKKAKNFGAGESSGGGPSGGPSGGESSHGESSQGGVYYMVSGESPELRVPSFQSAAKASGTRWKVTSQDASLPDPQYQTFLFTGTLER